MIHEAERRRLWQALSEQLGERQADTLMNLLQSSRLPVGLASSTDIAELRSEMRDHFARVETGFGILRSEVALLRTELNAASTTDESAG